MYMCKEGNPKLLNFRILANLMTLFKRLDLIKVYTVKSLIEARAFIRIITFSGEGGGRLLEAVVLANYV